MKFDPVPFDPPDHKAVGHFTANLSPDGWQDSMYVNEPSVGLTSDEVLECSRFINSFMHDCGSQDVFMKYVKKHGERIDNVTSAIFYNGDLLEYVVQTSGYSITINTHRKENV